MALPPLVGTIAKGLIGKLFGRKKSSNTVNYAALVKNSRKAGFNPLTALRNGGSANSTSTSPVFTGAEFIRDAIEGVTDTIFNRDQLERDAEMDEIKRELMREELKEVQSRNKRIAQNPNFGYSIPHVGTQSKKSGQIPASGSVGVLPDISPSVVPIHDSSSFLVPNEGGSPVTRDLLDDGQVHDVDEASSPAEDWENEYSELVSEYMGLKKFMRDNWTTNQKRELSKRMSVRPVLSRRRSRGDFYRSYRSGRPSPPFSISHNVAGERRSQLEYLKRKFPTKPWLTP